MNILETEQIQGYGFADFLEKIEKMINEGWQLDFSTNDNYPTSFGTYYSVGMIKVEKEAKVKGKKVKVEEVVPEATPETPPEAITSDLSVDIPKE